jgi:hypothetical protein
MVKAISDVAITCSVFRPALRVIFEPPDDAVRLLGLAPIPQMFGQSVGRVNQRACR